MSTVFDRSRINLEIPAIARFTFLNTADQGPKLASVHYRMQELENDTFFNSPSRADVYERLHSATEEARRELAAFFHADPAQTVFVRGIAEGLNILLPHVDLKPGDEVITTDQENPAVLLPLLEGSRQRGYKLRYVPVGKNRAEALAAMEAAYNSHTRLAVLSHVSHIGGFCQPVKEISEIIRRHGGRTIWDGAQSAGQIPVDFADLGCDVYLAAGYKWMLGWHGTAVMLLEREFMDAIRPACIGVGSESRFQALDNSYELKTDGRKFEYGSRYLPPFAALGQAARYLTGLGMENIVRRNRELQALLLRESSALPGLISLSSSEECSASGIVGLTWPGLNADDLVKFAWEKERILIKTRNLGPGLPNPKSVRISMHFFNTEDEVRHCAACLRQYRTLNPG